VTTLTSEERQAVVAEFASWASLQPRAPRDAASLVTGVTRAHDSVGLLATQIQGRRVVWQSVPASSRARVTFPAVAIETVDAWNVEAVALREKSDHIAVCDACAGDRKTLCHACGGRGNMTCTNCGGARKMYGYASNGSRRLLNCAACRGKGEIDCGHCKRGLAACSPCGGEGRVQRWIALQTWHRATTSRHLDAVAERFGWNIDPTDAEVARDAEIAFDIDRPYRLTAADLGSVPPQWLNALGTPLEPGERVARQRLRIATFPTYAIRYRLGAIESTEELIGRRFHAPLRSAANAFTQRAAKLGALTWLLLACGGVVALLSLGRGGFYWSIPTLVSLVAVSAALVATYGLVADRTAARRHLPRWRNAIIASAVAAIVFAIIALPRLAHAEALIVARDLARAELELQALGDRATPAAWADLRVAKIADAKSIEAARAELAQIPAESPQYAVAADAVDQLILRTAKDAAATLRFNDAAAALALLSDRARGRPDVISAAHDSYLALVRQKIAMKEWRAAGDAIAAARDLGIDARELDPLAAAIHDAAMIAVRRAADADTTRQRFDRRVAAEEMLTAWEHAANTSRSDELIALRVAMAHDVATLERTARRRGAS
jgi:hypothetical protein